MLVFLLEKPCLQQANGNHLDDNQVYKSYQDSKLGQRAVLRTDRSFIVLEEWEVEKGKKDIESKDSDEEETVAERGS